MRPAPAGPCLAVGRGQAGLRALLPGAVGSRSRPRWSERACPGKIRSGVASVSRADRQSSCIVHNVLDVVELFQLLRELVDQIVVFLRDFYFGDWDESNLARISLEAGLFHGALYCSKLIRGTQKRDFLVSVVDNVVCPGSNSSIGELIFLLLVNI